MMNPTVAIVAPGNMGAAVAARLVEHGVTVLTTLEGRGAASVARAAAAGMRAVGLRELVAADMVLSILPPAHAVGLAGELGPLLAETAARGVTPVFVDCNAVSPETKRQIGALVSQAGAPFVDGCIIGLPPRAGEASPHFYFSGEAAAVTRCARLAAYGLDVRVLEGPVGTAAALKMCYAGINKGIAALASVMILGAARSGATAALYQEMSESLPGLLESLRRQIPDMLPKTYRWVAEMGEIAAFNGAGTPAHEVFVGFAALFDSLARDVAGDKRDAAVLTGFFEARR